MQMQHSLRTVVADIDGPESKLRIYIVSAKTSYLKGGH